MLDASLASAKVPDVILAVSRFGISDADNESLADAIVPDVILDAGRSGISLAVKPPDIKFARSLAFVILLFLVKVFLVFC